MILTQEQFEKINKLNHFIIKWCDYFGDYEDELILDKEIIGKDDIEYINYNFPGFDEPSTHIDEILELCEEVPSIEIVNNSHIKTNKRSIFVVSSKDTNDDYIIKNYFGFETIESDSYSIQLIEESFLIGLVGTKLEEYDKDHWGTYSQYLAIEIKYKNSDSRPSSTEEIEILNSFIFEIADTYNYALTISEIRNPIYDIEELGGLEESKNNKLRELEPYNDGMKLFVSAIQINDPELKFLNFYKVLEHFAPIAINIEANELMRKKLDVPKATFENGDYIRSIFELAASVKERYNDEDLIKAAFFNCFDFIGLHNDLPDSIIKKIKKHIKSQELNYSTDKQKASTASNITAKIIYKTRNKVVHAKSNFTENNDEIKTSEFEQLNMFMKKAASQTIRWYSRQPSHLKLEII